MSGKKRLSLTGAFVLEPLLIQELQNARHEILPNVVFPTGINRCDDIGMPNRFDVYYGMVDARIGVARFDLPDIIPTEGVADSPSEKVWNM